MVSPLPKKFSSNFVLLFLLSALVISVFPFMSRTSSEHSTNFAHDRLPKRGHQCPHVHQRRAWHTFTDAEKQAYINAELCLMLNRPSRSGLPGTRSLFDDLQAVHQVQGEIVHSTGYFLPFHRLLIHAHEYLLGAECNYTGAQPYWDESPSAGRFSLDPIFSPILGFGGDGEAQISTTATISTAAAAATTTTTTSIPILSTSTFVPASPRPSHIPSNSTLNRRQVSWSLGTTTHTANCITTGPFAFYTLHVGPGMANTPHCISRQISDTASLLVSQPYVEQCLRMPNFKQAWRCIELTPHAGGHHGVGGEMYNPYSSPGDPLFYLHHAWIDKIWWDWQKLDLATRVKDITGRKHMYEPEDSPDTVALGDWLRMFGVVEDVRVGDVMDLREGRYCSEYVDPAYPVSTKHEKT